MRRPLYLLAIAALLATAAGCRGGVRAGYTPTYYYASSGYYATPAVSVQQAAPATVTYAAPAPVVYQQPATVYSQPAAVYYQQPAAVYYQQPAPVYRYPRVWGGARVYIGP